MSRKTEGIERQNTGQECAVPTASHLGRTQSFRRKINKKRFKKTSRASLFSSGIEEEMGGPVQKNNARKRRLVLSRKLSDLVQYTRSVGFPGFKDFTKGGFDVWSFSETKAQNVISARPSEFVRLAQGRLIRVYPSSYRIDSSNFNPVPFWCAGCQMVALNHQTKGRPMDFNHSLFSLNGGCGYVLKPSCLFEGNFNPHQQDSYREIMRLRIISAHQLPKPPNSVLGDRGEIIDPFVEVELFGVTPDCDKQQTTVIDDNGFNPVWDEELTFQLSRPELCFIRFTIWDQDPIGRDYIGQRTLLLQSLKQGYRHVHLTDCASASIFVKITFEPHNNNTIDYKFSRSNSLVQTNNHSLLYTSSRSSRSRTSFSLRRKKTIQVNHEANQKDTTGKDKPRSRARSSSTSLASSCDVSVCKEFSISKSSVGSEATNSTASVGSSFPSNDRSASTNEDHRMLRRTYL